MKCPIIMDSLMKQPVFKEYRSVNNESRKAFYIMTPKMDGFMKQLV